MILLMASTIFPYSDSFMATIDVIWQFVVAWKRARKVDNEDHESLGEILGTKTRLIFWRLFSRLPFGLSCMQWWSLQLRFLEKAVCKIVLLAAFFRSFPLESCEQLIR